ncbi:MAG TPA: IclR family transcriptional regulator [Bryobacteraceae bacterium]|jgi:IclR family acetate operon transcriptional repressor
MPPRAKPPRKSEPAGSIAVLHKAFDLLELLRQSEGAMSLDDVVSASHIPRSTAHRLLTDLVLRGYVEKDRAGHYQLGLTLLVLGATVRHRHNLRDISQPYMVGLRNQFEETVNLGRLQGDSVLYLETVESNHPIRMTGSLGILDPVHATAIGKSILAWLPPARRPAITNWKRLTPSTICDAGEFATELERVKKRGYALDDEESMEGGRCVGVPILHAGTPIAGLSLSGPITRLTRESVPGMADALKKASEHISEQLRFFPDKMRR